MMHKRRALSVVFGFSILFVLLAGCAATEGRGTPLAFEPHVRVTPEGQAKVTLGIHNISSTGMPAQASFNGGFRIESAQDGALIAEIPVPTLDRLGPGQSAFPIGWEGSLAPGEYQLIWGAQHFGVTELHFSVREGEWTMLDVNLHTTALDFEWDFSQ